MTISPDQKDYKPYDDKGLDRHIELALAIKEPPGIALTAFYEIIKRTFIPTVIDSEKIPEKPCIFIANHSLFALDGVVMLPIFHKQLQRFVRGMADKFLWSTATEKTLLKAGVVLGDPKVCSALMDDRQDILLFPGGAHEAVKKSSDNYQLQWKERYGFVRLAAHHGYTIVPVAQVGPDEFYRHLIEGEDLPDSIVGKMLTKFGLLSENTRKDIIPPLPMGSMGSLIPRPQHCYFQFGDPVDLSKHKGKKLGPKKLHSIRTEVADQIENMIEQLLTIREKEKIQKGLLRRILTI